MRLTPTRRRRRGNGAVESWTDARGETDAPAVGTPPLVAPVGEGSAARPHDGTTPSAELDRPLREPENAAADDNVQSEIQPVQTILVATALLQRLDTLQSQLDQAARQGQEHVHLAHDYRGACAEVIKQLPLLALSKDVDQLLWTSWQRELAALEGRVATASSKANEEMKLRDSLYVALRDYSALIQDVKTTSRSTALTTSEETAIALLVHRLSLAQAHVMYALAVHSSQDEKDWRIPELYYERARLCCVAQGETHYHLARIVLHDGRCCEALYHLVRSRTATSPFESPGSLGEQFVHLSSLRNSESGQDVASEWLQFDKVVLEAVAPYLGQQQEFMAQRRMPHALASALCILLDSICSTPSSSTSASDDANLVARPLRIVRVVLLIVACACLQEDLVQSTSSSAVESTDSATVKNPRAVELLVSLVNGLLHRFLSAITSPLKQAKEKEFALQLMLPAINIAFGWLSTISWREMVAESTKANCEQLSTMLLTGVIAGGFLAPHEEHKATESPPPLPEELELIGLSCVGGVDSRSLEAKLSESDTATDGAILQRRIVKFLSHVEAFMTPRPAAVAVIASAAPSRAVTGSGTDVSRQLEQLSLNAGSSVSPESANSSTTALPTAPREKEEARSPSSMNAPTVDSPPKSVVERVVVLDAANIAMRHGLQRRFSCRGIQLCAEYFIAQGDRVVAFLPDYCLDVDADGSFRRRVTYSGGRARRREGRCTITPDDRVLLEILVDSGVVVLTPAMDSDDLYCIHYARRHDAFLVTNDLFRDHISETEGPKARQTELRNWLQARRISYTWVADEFLPNPNSAYEKMRLTGASTDGSRA